MSEQRTLATALAGTLDALKRCQERRERAQKDGEVTERDYWVDRHDRYLQQLEQQLPSGSGWDVGTVLDREKSTDTRLVLHGSYHHMDDGGGYDGWTDHTITVRATLLGLDISVSGRDRNQIKSYLEDLFIDTLQALAEPFTEDGGGQAS